VAVVGDVAGVHARRDGVLPGAGARGDAGQNFPAVRSSTPPSSTKLALFATVHEPALMVAASPMAGSRPGAVVVPPATSEKADERKSALGSRCPVARAVADVDDVALIPAEAFLRLLHGALEALQRGDRDRRRVRHVRAPRRSRPS
jgi:hypothetical protein